MSLIISATAQALVFTGGCRLIHATRLRPEAVGHALAAVATVLAMILGMVLALSLATPDAVSDGAIRAQDPAFELFGP